MFCSCYTSLSLSLIYSHLELPFLCLEDFLKEGMESIFNYNILSKVQSVLMIGVI